MNPYVFTVTGFTQVFQGSRDVRNGSEIVGKKRGGIGLPPPPQPPLAIAGRIKHCPGPSLACCCWLEWRHYRGLGKKMTASDPWNLF